jgi:hypothetical protein
MKYLNKCQRDVMDVTSTNNFLAYKDGTIMDVKAT